jgi:hypothetical protein
MLPFRFHNPHANAIVKQVKDIGMDTVHRNIREPPFAHTKLDAAFIKRRARLVFVFVEHRIANLSTEYMRAHVCTVPSFKRLIW